MYAAARPDRAGAAAFTRTDTFFAERDCGALLPRTVNPVNRNVICSNAYRRDRLHYEHRDSMSSVAMRSPSPSAISPYWPMASQPIYCRTSRLLRERFVPDLASLPQVSVQRTPLIV